ncbi:MAG TPA: hypothetical protein VJH03_16970 [Blastocatellia bacterium]|nr:hypothetical protein [Blastocatellia bacterium]
MTHTILRFINAAALSILVFGGTAALAQEFSFPVRHDHAIGSCRGELMINAEGVEYKTSNKKDARKWTYTDVKMIKLVSPTEVEVLSYESSRATFGRDKTFDFRVLKGEVSKDVSDFLLARVSRPLATSFVKSEEKEQYAIPVRHRHSFGGDQGTLKIYADGVTYESIRTKDSRRWRWTDIQSVSRMGPYQFAITTYEPKFGGPTKTYNFDLKERMDDTVYDYLWARLYKPTLPASLEVRQDEQATQNRKERSHETRKKFIHGDRSTRSFAGTI